MVELYPAIGVDPETGVYVHLDSMTGALVSIDAVSHEVNEGNMFSASVKDADVDKNAAKYVSIIAPATHELHIEFAFSSDNAGLLELFEQPTITVAGSAVTVFNNNRGSTKVTTALVKEDPTVTVDGTLLDAVYVGSSNTNVKIGGGTRSTNELVLKAGYTYILKFTPTNDNTACAMTLSFYESEL